MAVDEARRHPDRSADRALLRLAQAGRPAPSAGARSRSTTAELLGIASADLRVPFSVHEVLARLLDGSEFSEYKPDLAGTSLVTELGHAARLPGRGVGQRPRGDLLSEEANKATEFIQLSNQTNTPVGLPAEHHRLHRRQVFEQGGIIKDGAKMINAVANSAVPHFTVIIGGLLRGPVTTACAGGPTSRASCSPGRTRASR